MRILIFVLFSLTYSSGSRHVSLTCQTSNTSTSALNDEIVKDLKEEVALLKLQIRELSVSIKEQTITLKEMMEDKSLKLSSESTVSKLKAYPRSCSEATATNHSNGIYSIQLNSIGPVPFSVVCDDKTQGGGWTVIQRRMDGSVDFFRDWDSYKNGFGDFETEFFIGLDKLHALTNENGPQELLIVMSDFEGATKYAKYSSFAIGDESEDYVLKVLGKYSGDATDSLTFHFGQKFSTRDRQNDIDAQRNCAEVFKGAWWYKNCHASNLNGLYLRGSYSNDKYAQGIVWFNWHGHYYSLKDVKMMIRSNKNCFSNV